ncbi:MAG: hypothetical protein KatS3mg087_1047 [Patescibacteria group bacterium]|nr:MAG: hypothetical protein KatS3mg087_1047 [Patescibacteria group bacterium]
MKKKHHTRRSVGKKRATRKTKMEVPNVPQPFMTGGKGSPIGHVPDISHVLKRKGIK